MTSPIRQQIMDSLGNLLKTINGTGSYSTDFSQSVFDFAPGTIEEQSAPAITYRDADCKTDNYNTDNRIPIDIHQHRLSIELEAKIAGDASSAAVRNAIADIMLMIGSQANGANPGRWGGLATVTDPTGDVIARNIKDQVFSSVIVRFMITFRTAAWDPYTVR